MVTFYMYKYLQLIQSDMMACLFALLTLHMHSAFINWVAEHTR